MKISYKDAMYSWIKSGDYCLEDDEDMCCPLCGEPIIEDDWPIIDFDLDKKETKCPICEEYF